MSLIIFLELTDVFGKEITNESEKKVLKSCCRFFQDMENVNLKESENFKVEENVRNLFGFEEDELFFVRPSYLKLAETIFNSRNLNKTVLLSGTPGIGKTVFTIYWVWYLLRQSINKDISV
jgi:hypothetical protein